MIQKKWEAIPGNLRVDAFRPYYALLATRSSSPLLTHCFDMMVSAGNKS